MSPISWNSLFCKERIAFFCTLFVSVSIMRWDAALLSAFCFKYICNCYLIRLRPICENSILFHPLGEFTASIITCFDSSQCPVIVFFNVCSEMVNISVNNKNKFLNVSFLSRFLFNFSKTLLS